MSVQQWYERILRIVSLSPRVEEPNLEVKKLINVLTWTTVSAPVNVLCISLYLNLYLCRWIEISLWLWYDCGHGCEYTTPTPLQRPNKSSTQRTAKVRYVETEAISSDKSIYALRSLSDRKHYHADVRLSTPEDCTKIASKLQIDTGASCTTLAFADYKRITKAPLQPSHTKLNLYDNSILQPLGSVTLHCEVKGIRKKSPSKLWTASHHHYFSNRLAPLWSS